MDFFPVARRPNQDAHSAEKSRRCRRCCQPKRGLRKWAGVCGCTVGFVGCLHCWFRCADQETGRKSGFYPQTMRCRWRALQKRRQLAGHSYQRWW
ncbi:hypothetical protein M441DRAFT_362997 [Trichoderma asperellum CBS 433.97]|uniref:Uncharacterized protein n=1 Tax=Trichoderma asperellum (strain ATCC 204424 / CBS 433.97 / NBRC 101777) TaxID=1042311 RepID=A0A2T3ZDV8_TRIA4|nr:hypothetical protein M441DRAFT_362997 [Trichoderma asperellum CBS 433.97]PTB42989.1 hypothetical protein M441DRAFT_362997 [Trichoderma asperellum CBS 433.97]